ncbi:MAG: LysR family transcriptional regulator [Gallicola sp.]|nr:LysR family transcriptional regulator [Gallicola sp.]
METKRFLNAVDVSKRMEISVPMAYKIIKKLNEELKAKGYLTVAGKVSRVFFEEKLYDTVAS